MKNIIFLDRKDELALVDSIAQENFFLVVKGRRRIGKTTFLKRCFPESVYIFIWPNKSLEWLTQKICEENKLPAFKNFIDILNYFLEQKKTIILDEFQNFLSVDKSIYGEIQNLIDERKNKFLKIAVAGSSYSLMNKVFSNIASPLYGRRTVEITLSNIPIKDLFNFSKMPLEDFIATWSVFEGVPYYYELMQLTDAPNKIIKDLLLAKTAILQEEGKAILSVEFGQDSKTYSTILSAISEGKNKINEINSVFNNKINEVIKYLNILRNDFRLIKRITPILSEPKKSKEGKYEILDNFLSFWLYFLDKQKDYIEQERFLEVTQFFEKNFNGFIGRKFEKFILELINRDLISLPFKFDKIGRQWGSIRGKEKDKDQYEIDFLALNEKTKEIVFGECKWKDKVNAKEVMSSLKEKSSYIDWNKESRTEYFMLFAKTFDKKISEFEGKKVFCLDLNDLEVKLKK